jgi:hypothetical protein
MYDADQVWLALRDHMLWLASYWDGIESIEEVERTVLEDGALRTVHLWQGCYSFVPRPIRPFVSPAMLQWTVRSVWNDRRRIVSWELESARFDRLYLCQGQAHYHRLDEGGTSISLQGELIAYPEKIPHVPRLISRRFQPGIERLLVRLTRANLARLTHGLEALLAAHQMPQVASDQ